MEFSGVVKPYADFREIMARADVDAVIVGAHDNWNTPMSLAAINASKDAYCQKPLGLDYGLTSNQSLWKQKFKPADEQLPVSPEHNRNFIDCVKSRQEPMCPVEMSIRCDAICQLATLAAVTGRAIQWDPEQEKIVNDAEAAKMLVRPYREKWKVW